MRSLLVASVALLAPSVLHGQGTTAGGGTISVGPAYQVSKPFPKLAHYENLVAADPDHAGRILACSTVAHEDLASQGNHCYVSFDAGKSWSTVLEFDKGPRNSDPAMIYGRGDTVFYINEHIPGGSGNRMEVYRSTDGGRKWEMTTTFPFVDRQAVIVDETNGKYGGRIYVNGVSKGFDTVSPASSLLYRSLDGGATFLGPVERPTTEGSGLLGASNVVVLSDGTVAFTTFMYKKGRSPNALDEGSLYRGNGNVELKLLTSSDGGESFDPWVTISDVSLDLQQSQGGLFAQIAVDPGSPYFKDRLYAVWPDISSGRVDVRFAYSTDKGKTWSTPVTINDDRPPLEKGRGPDHMLPAIAVNKKGAVLIVWYDRREFPDNMGWRMRATASLDGGVSFAPSVPISDVANTFSDKTPWVLETPRSGGGGGGAGRRGTMPSRGRPLTVDLSVNGFFLSGGHTSGMAAGADDVFYPLWSDNRSGISQLWMAPIIVRGTVEKHGARELAELDDVTDKLAWETRANSFDRATGTLSVTARLRNTSSDTLRGPLKVRVVRLTSQLGTPSIVAATNGTGGIGAIWDFGGAIPAAGLLPDSTTAVKTLTFRLSSVRPLRPARQSPGFTSGLLHFEARAYGKPTGGARAASR